MDQFLSPYQVGALLYCPANGHDSIVDSLINQSFPSPFSLAFCLEDTVRDEDVEDAEVQLFQTLSKIAKAHSANDFFLPLIFVRIRSAAQLDKLIRKFSVFSDILTGFIIPKFFIESCDPYIDVIKRYQNIPAYDFWYMPIFESSTMIDLSTRYQNLSATKKRLSAVQDRILNIRVGGNDLLHAFSLRRHATDSIYDVRPVSNLLADIVATFSDSYVISGPVWEYYSGPNWKEGLQRELELDMLNGFIGKTVIHPNQIAVVNNSLKISRADFEDASSILNWDEKDRQLVSSSAQCSRMNEYNTHFRWAKKTLALASIYGIRDE